MAPKILGRRLACVAMLGTLPALMPLPATLEGRVRLHADGSPVVDARVFLVTAGRLARTDDDGHFTFGDYELTEPDTLLVTHPDYAEFRLPLGHLGDGPAWSLEIQIPIRPSPVPVGLEGDDRW